MINRNHQSDAEYIAKMKDAWGTQLDTYILTIRRLENTIESLCSQLDKLEEQQKAHDTLKSEHRRLLADRQFWFEECDRIRQFWFKECDRIKAKLGELNERFAAEKHERVLFEQENAKHQRNALRVSLEEARKENARLKSQLKSQSSSTATVVFPIKHGLPTGWILSTTQPHKPLSLQQLIEGHAEALRQSVEGFPPWVQELKVKEQLGFFEPILEGPADCQKTS